MNSADGTFYALTQAMTEEKRVEIDTFIKWTYFTDYATHNGHFYSDREPGVSLIGIPTYILAKALASKATLPYNGKVSHVDNDSKIQALTYLSTIMISSLGIVFAYLIGKQLKLSDLSSLFIAFSIGLGTLFWKYSFSFYREPIFASFLFFGLFYYIKSLINKKKSSLMLCGFFSTCSLLFDYSKFFIIPIFFLFLLIWMSKKKDIVFFIAGCIPPLLLIFTYNYLAFENIFTNPHLHKTYFIWMQNPSNLFRAPLVLSTYINLFNIGPVPKEALHFFWDKPYINYQMGASWATINSYKGIFIQTPVLFLACFGFIEGWKKNIKYIVPILVIAITIILVISKHTVFWSGNTYDTRYFLAATLLLLIGTGFWMEEIISSKNKLKKITYLGCTIFLLEVSIYNGWYSSVTHFAPHVTGENRFYLSQLTSPLVSTENIKALFINTFPNIYNIHLLILFYFPISFLIYVIIFHRKPVIKLLMKLKKNETI